MEMFVVAGNVAGILLTFITLHASRTAISRMTRTDLLISTWKRNGGAQCPMKYRMVVPLGRVTKRERGMYTSEHETDWNAKLAKNNNDSGDGEEPRTGCLYCDIWQSL